MTSNQLLNRFKRNLPELFDRKFTIVCWDGDELQLAWIDLFLSIDFFQREGKWVALFMVVEDEYFEEFVITEEYANWETMIAFVKTRIEVGEGV